MVKNLPIKQEIQDTGVRSLGWENPLEKKIATHSSIVAWEIPFGIHRFDLLAVQGTLKSLLDMTGQ